MTAYFFARPLAALLVLAAAGPDRVSADARQTAQAARVSSEFRGTTRGRQGYVDHIWRLEANGRITGQSTERRGGGQGGYTIELSDTGRWQARQGRLCIDWSGSFSALSGCYGVARQQGTHVRLDGPQSFEGVFDPVPPLQ